MQSIMREDSEPNATKRVASMAKKARHLVRQQKEIEKAIEQRWGKALSGGPSWVGQHLPAVQVDSWWVQSAPMPLHVYCPFQRAGWVLFQFGCEVMAFNCVARGSSTGAAIVPAHSDLGKMFAGALAFLSSSCASWTSPADRSCSSAGRITRPRTVSSTWSRKR